MFSQGNQILRLAATTYVQEGKFVETVNDINSGQDYCEISVHPNSVLVGDDHFIRRPIIINTSYKKINPKSYQWDFLNQTAPFSRIQCFIQTLNPTITDLKNIFRMDVVVYGEDTANTSGQSVTPIHENKIFSAVGLLNLPDQGYCTATKVGHDILITVSHCLKNYKKLKDFSFTPGVRSQVNKLKSFTLIDYWPKENLETYLSTKKDNWIFVKVKIPDEDRKYWRLFAAAPMANSQEIYHQKSVIKSPQFISVGYPLRQFQLNYFLHGYTTQERLYYGCTTPAGQQDYSCIWRSKTESPGTVKVRV